MITHMYIYPQELPQRYEEPTYPNSQLREAQGKVGEETGGPWTRIFMALIRINTRKHNMFLFSEDARQKSIIRLAVNNWYNPTSHRLNTTWAARQRATRLVAHPALPGPEPVGPHWPTLIPSAAAERGADSPSTHRMEEPDDNAYRDLFFGWDDEEYPPSKPPPGLGNTPLPVRGFLPHTPPGDETEVLPDTG